MPDLLIELFSEEIPARMQARAAEDLKKRMTDALVEAGLTYAGAAAFHTPRRLALTVHGLLAESPLVREDARGPASMRRKRRSRASCAARACPATSWKSATRKRAASSTP